LGQLAVRFLCEAEIVGALGRHFLCDSQDLANDVEIVFLRFFVDTPLLVKVPIMPSQVRAANSLSNSNLKGLNSAFSSSLHSFSTKDTNLKAATLS
jgi:hypothetical protein